MSENKRGTTNRNCTQLHGCVTLYKASELQVRIKFGVVTEVSTFFIITQVIISSGFKKNIFSKCTYLHAKIVWVL